MFEEAIRLKLRFPFRGQCPTEDLWDIPIKKDKDGNYVSELDDIYCELDAIKQQKQRGLLSKKTEEDEILELKINIVKYILETKLEEMKVRENEVLKAEKKQKLLGFIAKKQDEKYEGMSLEDLNKLVDEL